VLPCPDLRAWRLLSLLHLQLLCALLCRNALLLLRCQLRLHLCQLLLQLRCPLLRCSQLPLCCQPGCVLRLQLLQKLLLSLRLCRSRQPRRRVRPAGDAFVG
jgi:hypothetical protein